MGQMFDPFDPFDPFDLFNPFDSFEPFNPFDPRVTSHHEVVTHDRGAEMIDRRVARCHSCA